MRRLVLFDIDGTILSSTSAGKRALHRAFADEYEALEFFDKVRLDGKTDRQIVRELYHAAGTPEHATDERISRVIDRYTGHLRTVLVEPATKVRTFPGIVALLDALHALDDVVVGLLTGNVVLGAQLKLGAAGVDFNRFRIGAFGSDSEHRPELPAIAAARAETIFGRRPHGEEVVIIGETPADVTCGNGISARAVAVATGAYSVADLRAAGAAAAFEDFSDTTRALEAILCTKPT